MKNMEFVLREVDRLFDENRAKEAEVFLQDALEEAREEEELGVCLQLLNELIGYYRQTSEKEKLTQTIEEALQIAEVMDLKDTIWYGTTALNAANGYRSMGNLELSEKYYDVVRVGMTADISLDAYENQLFRGTFATKYPTIDQATHTFPVEILMSNEKQLIRPGMYARATLSMSSSQHVLVPDVAVVKQIGAGDHYVYVYNNGKVSYNKVELGQHMEDKYEIISGVADGDMVVVAGMNRLANGKEVEVVK